MWQENAVTLPVPDEEYRSEVSDTEDEFEV